MSFKHFLGYDKGEDGKPKISEKEAEVIRYIYRQFLLDKSITGICKDLTARNIKTPSGLDIWRESTVFSILSNEKYKGDALLQKKIHCRFFAKENEKNEGEVPQYYVEGHHDPIISPDEFEIIQAEIKKRAELGRKYSAASIFSSKILCGDCGSFYGSKFWHSTDKYRKPYGNAITSLKAQNALLPILMKM
ncbi:MAG: recombinase family protein [Clostridia bacterium]|nr:recombinase family protein [Clostridia bacterium]